MKILEALRGAFKAILFKRFFGSIIGGIKGFLLSTAFNQAWNKIVEPLYYAIIRSLIVWRGARRLDKAIKKIREANNEDDFDDAVDDLP